MKIYNRVVIDMTTGKTIEEDSYEYNGQVALCKGGRGSSESKSDVPEWVRPYYTMIGGRISRLMDRPLYFYPGQLVAGFTPEQEQAYSLMTQRALSGSPYTQAAGGELMKTLKGDYYTSEPFKKSFQLAMEDTLPQVNASARQAGLYGSSSHDLMMGKALGDIAARMYEPERQRQMLAMQYAPTLGREDYYDIAQLAWVGAERRAMEQALIDAMRERFEFEQMEPWQRYTMAANILGSLPIGGVATTTTRTRGK